MAQATEIQWAGTAEEQQIARTVFELLTARARFYSEDAPIRQRLTNLQEYLTSTSQVALPGEGSITREVISNSLAANAHVFGREEQDGEITFSTTKVGVPPVDPALKVDTAHTYRSRLFTGSRVPTDEDLQAVRGIGRDIPEIIMVMPEPTNVIFPDMYSDEVEPEIAAEAELFVEEEPEPTHASSVLVGGVEVDLTQDPSVILAQHGPAFQRVLSSFLEEDFRFVRFGNEYYLEDRLERLSKGQLKEIKEYIEERGEPLSDEEVLSDGLVNRRLGDADYSLQRFTLNFRLQREKKDFRFVGTAADRLWATAQLPPIGQTVRKATEVAQDYRYLTDPELADQDPTTTPGGTGNLVLRHVLTWYESENGVLPVGPSAQLMMPQPLMEDQTVVVLRLQDPLNYATYLAELRLGLGTRGTYIAGLEEFYQSALVPGATFSLIQGTTSNEFTLEYERQPQTESRLLQYDIRKERWYFGPVVYECPVDPGYLLTEEKVGGLNGKKRASEADRKRVDRLLQSAFDLVGEPGMGGTRTALIDDLLPVLNIERPFSSRYVRSLIESPQYPQFTLEDEALGLVSYAGS